jgi:hypothetical protein
MNNNNNFIDGTSLFRIRIGSWDMILQLYIQVERKPSISWERRENFHIILYIYAVQSK